MNNKNQNVSHDIYSDLIVDSYKESATPGVLGTLRGRFSTSAETSRNGNDYTPELWRYITSAPTIQEMIDNRTFFGELSHPPREAEFLTEVQMNNVSHNITYLNYDETTGEVTGELDILDTPAGRIAHTFLKYGSRLGISSRGITISEDDTTVMTPDNYYLVTWDLVALPGIRGARLDPVTESVTPASKKSKIDTSRTQLKKAITEAINVGDDGALRIFKSCLESSTLPDRAKLVDLIDSELVELSNQIDQDVEKSAEQEITSDPSDPENSAESKEESPEEATESTTTSDVGGVVNGINILPKADSDPEKLRSILSSISKINSCTENDDMLSLEVDMSQLEKLLDVLSPDYEVVEVTVDPDEGIKADTIMSEDSVDEGTLDEMSNTLDEMKELVSEIASKKDEVIEELTKDKEKALTECKKLRTKLHRSESRIKTLTESMNSLEKRKNEAISKLSSKNRELLKLNSKSTNESVKIKKSLESERKSIAKLTKKSEALQRQVSNLTSLLESETKYNQSVINERKSRFAKLVESKQILRSRDQSTDIVDEELDATMKVLESVYSKKVGSLIRGGK